MLARRTQVADEITKTIDALGRLVAEELDLQGQLRRIAEADGSRTNPFSTASMIMDVINSELTRAGVSPYRADPRHRLTVLVDSQHVRYRAQRTLRKQVAARAVA
jgi:hypothetical protein